MSKIMTDLNNLGETRKELGGIIKDDSQKNEQGTVIGKHKGIYVLSFFILVLIACSGFLISMSLKTLSQVEEAQIESNTMIQMLKNHGEVIEALEPLIADNAANDLVQWNALTSQLNDLKVGLRDLKKDFSDVKSGYHQFKTSTKKSLDELKTADQKILKKHNSLDKEFKKVIENNSFLLSTY